MYWLSIAGNEPLSSAVIQRRVDDAVTDENHIEAGRHVGAIERIGSRGVSYANEDFDVLSAALRFAEDAERQNRMTYGGLTHNHSAGSMFCPLCGDD